MSAVPTDVVVGLVVLTPWVASTVAVIKALCLVKLDGHVKVRFCAYISINVNPQDTLGIFII